MFLGLEYGHPLSIESNDGSSTLTTHALRNVTTSIGAHRWELSIALEPRGELDQAIADLFAHRAKNGYAVPFEISFPQLVADRPQLPSGTRLRTAGVTAKRIPAVTLARIPNFRVAALVRQFVKFADHPKIYMIESVISSNVIGLTPSLRQDVPAGTEIILNPMVTVTHDPDLPQLTATDALGITRPLLSVVEDV